MISEEEIREIIEGLEAHLAFLVSKGKGGASDWTIASLELEYYKDMLREYE